MYRRRDSDGPLIFATRSSTLRFVDGTQDGRDRMKPIEKKPYVKPTLTKAGTLSKTAGDHGISPRTS